MLLNNITFTHSPFWIIICIILGISASLLLYYKNQAKNDLPNWAAWLLPILRGTLVTTILLLLLDIFFNFRQNTIQKPIIAIVQDMSESVGKYINQESNGLSKNKEAFIQSLAKQYDVKEYYFAGNTTTDKAALKDLSSTDIQSGLSDVMNTEDLQLLKGILLVSDGIFNKGSNPIYSAQQSTCPIWTVPLGDTSVQSDLAIANIFYNKIAYKGDISQIQLDIQASNLINQKSVLKLLDINGKELFQKVININKNDFFETVDAKVTIEKEGIQEFSVVLAPLKGEKYTVNNSKKIFIEVIDTRKNIHIYASSPHPDLGALKAKIESTKNYQVFIHTGSNLQITNEKIDLAILHQIPTQGVSQTALLQTIKTKQIPTWYIVGMQSDMNALNQAQNIVQSKTNNNQASEAKPSLNANFTLFIKDSLVPNKSITPLISPFGDYKLNNGSSALFSQKIKNINTEYPLLAFSNTQPRSGILIGEGIWQWKLNENLIDNKQFVDDVVLKTIQYLSVKEDKRQFQTSIAKTLFSENEKVSLAATLYNASFEPINDPEVSLQLTKDGKEKFQYTFSRKDNFYDLPLGTLSPGKYSYIASTQYNNQKLTSEGKFLVESINLEQSNLKTNISLLSGISKASKGAVVFPNELENFAKKILEEPVSKPVIFSNITNEPILSMPWILAIIIAIMLLEWILRRYLMNY